MKQIVQIVVITIMLAMHSAVPAYDAGVSVYNSKCVICHASGVAGAPKVGDPQAWAPRIAAGMDAMLANAINGKNSMPPMGTCTECSEADLATAIEYMVSKSR